MNIKRIGIVVALVLGGVVLLSSVVKHKAKHLAVVALEESSGGVMKYHHLSLNVVRSFPQLHFEVSGLVLAHASEVDYEVDTLTATLSIAKILSNELHVSSLRLIRPQVYISPRSTTAKSVNTSEAGDTEALPVGGRVEDRLPFNLSVDQLFIKNGSFRYQFADSSYWALRGINSEIAADIASPKSMIDLSATIAAFDYNTDDLAFMGVFLGTKCHLSIEDDILRIEQGELNLSHISHQLSGQINLSSHPDFNLEFVSEEASVASLFSLFSQTALQDTNLIVTGRLQSKGLIKGPYLGTESWPLMQLQLETSDASMAFKKQQSKIDHMSVRALFMHPQGASLDATELILDSLHLRSGDNYLRGQVQMRSVISSPYINAQLNGDVDLSEMVEVFPINAMVLEGKLKADINMAGQLSDISQENYKAFVADGQVRLRHFYLNNKQFPQGLRVDNAAFDFSPESIRLRSFDGRLGRSELNLQGKFYNYISYIFDDDDLKGELELTSNYINLNEFRQKQAQVSPTSVSRGLSESSSPFMVPRGLNLILKTNIRALLVDGTTLSRCQGKVALKDQRLHLENLSFNTFGGAVSLTGSYDTQDKSKLKSNLHIYAKEVQLEKAATTLSVLQKSLPVSQMAQGDVTTRMSYYAEMDEKGTLDLEHLKAKGVIESQGLRFSNHPSLNKLASQLKDPRYKDFTTSPFAISFNMENGQLDVAPFDVKIVERNIHAGGWYRIDNTINFRVKTTVKAKEIGGDVSKYVAMLSDANKPLPVTVVLTGDAQAPDIKYDTREAISILRKDVTKNLNNDAVKSILKGFFN